MSEGRGGEGGGLLSQVTKRDGVRERGQTWGVTAARCRAACAWVEARGGGGRGHRSGVDAGGWCEVLAHLALSGGQMAGVGRPMAVAGRLGHTQRLGGTNERTRWRGAPGGGVRT